MLSIGHEHEQLRRSDCGGYIFGLLSLFRQIIAVNIIFQFLKDVVTMSNAVSKNAEGDPEPQMS